MGMGHEELLTGRKGPNALRRGRQKGGGRWAAAWLLCDQWARCKPTTPGVKGQTGLDRLPATTRREAEAGKTQTENRKAAGFRHRRGVSLVGKLRPDCRTVPVPVVQPKKPLVERLVAERDLERTVAAARIVQGQRAIPGYLAILNGPEKTSSDPVGVALDGSRKRR